MSVRSTGGMSYHPEDWRERGIRARRFSPCPHCGSAVTARERIHTPPNGVQAVFREARCLGEGCGWRYIQHGGTREEFVRRANARHG